MGYGISRELSGYDGTTFITELDQYEGVPYPEAVSCQCFSYHFPSYVSLTVI